ncbi:DUF4199 domain-containing protein [Christiangramia forsetii]|uniref:Membrane protein n=2 Tax=Christiangramia forsetii TaxID=411153 RepID=A0M091_CHRFK|nr:DUF4199 domain-containing protein [Christiangramia forsetii]GGG41515.1 hypothetical protein GCM10011532_26560 [Christiangramia forsetii]CAL66036.1 membrane protein [Christiangramia forsetii KT0803]
MEQTTKKLATSYGLYLGLALILIAVLVYAFDISLMIEWYYTPIIYLIILAISIMAVSKTKKYYTGIFSFKEAFSAYFLTVLIGLVLSTIFSLILFNVIDPEAAGTIQELTMEKQAEMFEKFGMTEAQINETMLKMQEENFFSLKNVLISVAVQLVIFSIIGLIVALIFREKDTTNV